MFIFASEEKYSDGQVIFNENSSGDWIYVVISGSVEISRMIDKKKFVLEVLNEGEPFGELSYIGGGKRVATATALGETTLGIIDRDSLDIEFNKLSSDFRSILVAVVRRFKIMIERVTDFSSRTETRIPKTLSVSYKDKKSFLTAYTSNISGRGLFIKTSNPLPVGEMFLLKLQLPEIPEPLKIKSMVVWADKEGGDEGTHPSGMGIKFNEMSGKDNESLQKFLKPLYRS
jgi:CRP/FNR family transcriptional regulator, cyclic AMP receptor protein